jgi:TRAP-type C4-dicarboxylate transport system permease large subunit
MRTIYRGVIPFIIADFGVLALLMLFPELALWLPRMLG